MPSSFGRKKPAARQIEQAQAPAWLLWAKAPSAAARETQQALYRITGSEPSRLERARMMRGVGVSH